MDDFTIKAICVQHKKWKRVFMFSMHKTIRRFVGNADQPADRFKGMKCLYLDMFLLKLGAVSNVDRDPVEREIGCGIT